MWIEILEKCDDNKDGKIEKEEFSNLLVQLFKMTINEKEKPTQ